MIERIKPTINKVLFVSDEALEAMKPWPLELRAIFDPRADRELTERIQQEKQAARRPRFIEENAIRFCAIKP